MEKNGGHKEIKPKLGRIIDTKLVVIRKFLMRIELSYI